MRNPPLNMMRLWQMKKGLENGQRRLYDPSSVMRAYYNPSSESMDSAM
jgi:hypothetical protein